MERHDVHVIIQATPDHWHTLVNLAAAQAKKDVYGEKPLTLTIDEGKRLVHAVRQNKIVLQTGLNSGATRISGSRASWFAMEGLVNSSKRRCIFRQDCEAGRSGRCLCPRA